MYIKTERLEIKPITDSDRDNVISLLTDDIVKQTYMVPDFETEESVIKLFHRLKDLSHSDGFYQVGIYLEDNLIGIANEVGREEDRIELGYAILPDYHNQGYGTEMLNALIYQMHAEGFSKVVTGAFEENISSIRVMEKCGMQRIEKTDEIEYRGKVHTCVYYVRRNVVLETKDLIIKQAEQKDWKDMYYNIWRHAESAKYMLWKVTSSEEEAQVRMQKTIAYEQTHPYAWLVYEKASGQAIGFAGMTEVEPGVYEDMGIALGPDFVGKGYGKQIVNAMVDYAKNELGAKKMLLSYRSQNIASKKLQEACGFIYSHSEDRVDPRTNEGYVVEFTYKEL